MVEESSTPGIFRAVESVAGVAGRAYIGGGWAGSLMRVPTGASGAVALSAPSTVAVRTRHAGQSLTVGGSTTTSASANQVLRAFGSGSAVFGPGDWAQLTIVEGQYDGPLFDGDLNPDPAKWDVTWTGEVDASTSTLREIPADPASEDWHPGEGVPMVVVRDPSQTMQLALPGNHRSDYAVTIEEVG